MHQSSAPLTMPALGLGTWKAMDKQAYNSVYQAIQCGYRHIDCAPIYMNEKPVGNAIQAAIQAQLATREQLWITSKLWNSFHESDQVAAALKQTLHFMQLDYLDLFLIHWPVAMKPQCGHARVKSASDYLSLKQAPLDATWEAMISCQQQGLTKRIGVANFSISKIQLLIDKTGHVPFNNQVECHPYLTQNDLREFCQNQGISFSAYSPLGSGDRPTLLKKPNEPSLLNNPVIVDIAAQHQVSSAQVLLAWSINKNQAVLPKAITSAHIKDNFAALGLTLNNKQLHTIDQLNQNFRYIDGHFFEKTGSIYTASTVWQ